ncbi:VOC family protein [Gillisia limnaea]|uniref:Glyoxalase/bleomycin resistance protein/dioxygenase n=1 Tax=Gillisia limnaea (strain DSM 15749 / LMG 21470 / R-8282) TaxID=865937 RepID=H2BRF2_GILLR|nr:VOC family protein [Gillisia limnaea]EHQ04471.1 Glyoxalase/bleomycin resistance protein/dioxygenase [Gillisia limnaea DSM 15749]
MGGVSSKKKKQEKLKDYISWFEIPAINFQQAVDFYNEIYDIDMEKNFDDNYAMAFFPAEKGIGGAIVAGPGSIPGIIGPLLYLNAGKDLNIVLERVESAGGRIVMTKTLINEESGYFAIFIDSEGNKLALHSKK